jgi:excisionase family DNA binding protein
MESSVSTITAILADQSKSLFDTRKAAEYLGVEPGTLEVWRCTKRHRIPFIKVGRLVRYRKEALDGFLMSNTVDAEVA